MPKSTFHLAEGDTKCIAETPTKFLGQTKNHTLTKRTASAKLKDTISAGLNKIDSRPIRGKLKLWILRHYLIPSVCFQMMVDQIQPTTIAPLENLIAKFVKKWLKLPRNATQAIIYQPSVVKTPSLTSMKIRAKLLLLVSLNHSMDLSLTELNTILNDPAFLRRNDISDETSGLFEMVDQGQPDKALKAAIKKTVMEKE